MAGIIGVVGLKDPASLIRRMARVMRHHQNQREDVYLGDGIALGRIGLNIKGSHPQPIFNEDHTLCLVMDGEVLDYQKMKSDLVSKGHRFRLGDDPEFLLHFLEERGLHSVKFLNGSFVAALWDSKDKRLALINDPLGFRHLYWTQVNGKLVFASEVKAILEDEDFNRVVNDEAVADFFSFGFLLGDKTLFQGIRLLPPGSILLYHQGKVTIENYWQLRYLDNSDGYPADHYADELAGLLRKAVQRRIKGENRFGVLLSGGLDSRLIAVFVRELQLPLITFTMGEPDSKDVTIAHAVSRELGSSHNFLRLRPEDLIRYAPEAVWLTDGMYNCLDSQILWIADKLREKIDVVLEGIQLLDGFYHFWEIPLLRDKRRNIRRDIKFIKRIFSPFLQESPIRPMEKLRSLFSPDYYRKIKDYPWSSFYETVLNRPDEDWPLYDRLDYHFVTQRLRRFTSYGSFLLRSRVEVRSPFLDRELLDFFISLPAKYRSQDKSLYRKILINMAPDLVKIPWERTGLHLEAGTLRFLIKKIQQRWASLFKSDFTYSHLVDYSQWLAKDVRIQRFLRDYILGKKALMRGYFQPATLKKILEDQFLLRKNNLDLIGKLLTFEIWNRMFIDEEECFARTCRSSGF